MSPSETGDDRPTRHWFRDWFGEEYLELYPHRDEEEAERAVRLYREAVEPSGPVLDLACGAGRHLRELARSGVPAVGLDLSRALLAEARAADPEARLVRGDMRRLPFADGAFGGLTSFFTSFGYFAARADDRQVAREIRRVLRPGGSFMLDFFNADRVREELVPRDVREFAGRRVTQTRRIVDDTVVKRIRIEELEPDGEDAGPRYFHERVRLYTDEELTGLLEAAGLRVARRYGDYEGREAGPEAERLILVGEAT